MIEIPRRLGCNIEADDDPSRHAWLARLEQIAQLGASWSLVLGEPGGSARGLRPPGTGRVASSC